jgi:uncharacterized membrane protein YdjX (TVP38/TMEM64 family)/rhodanese-related sulfurtransferase
MGISIFRSRFTLAPGATVANMKQGKRFLHIIGLLLLITAVAVALWLGRSLDAITIVQRVGELGPLAWLVFMVIYALATVLFLPGSVLTLAGGSLFGPVLGTFVNLTGATLGATMAFLLSRYLASDWVEQKTGGRLKQLKDGVEGEGWRFVALVRLVPLFPFNLLNYALGLTRIRLLHYLVATYVCMLPGAFAYSYLGYAGREAVAGGEGLIQKGLLALALLALVAFLPRIISRFRQGPSMSIHELGERLVGNDEQLLLDVRTADDYRGELGHIHGAQNIALEELQARLLDLSDHAEKTIALICTTDRRSGKAARLLNDYGFAHVRVVAGGMSAWGRAGLPVES